MPSVHDYHLSLPEHQRRAQGAFFTPKKWVDYLHSRIENDLGNGWEEKYLVYDPACGTGALTYGLHCLELVLSTLEEDELKLATDMQSPTEAMQLDFLGPGIPWTVAQAILEDRDIVIITNPPYGKPPAETLVNTRMKGLKMGKAATEMSTMFLYKLRDFLTRYQYGGVCHIYSITKNFLTAPSYATFNKFFFEDFSVDWGVVFPSTEFPGITSKWPVIMMHTVNRQTWTHDKESDTFPPFSVLI